MEKVKGEFQAGAVLFCHIPPNSGKNGVELTGNTGRNSGVMLLSSRLPDSVTVGGSLVTNSTGTAGGLLDRVAKHRTRIGYGYLETAVELVIRKGVFPAKGLMKLYGEITEREKKSARTVSRDIARAVEDLWECGDVKLLQKLLDRQMISGTSPGETIFLLANYLSGGKIRLK